MTFDDVALAVLQRAWPAYVIAYVAGDGVWVARFSADQAAPVIAGDSPETLTTLLGDDTSRRRRGGDSG